MPWSHTEGKSWLCERYDALKPKTVVEIGPGAGLYGKWMRQNHRANWAAIEAWEPYVSQFNLSKLYDTVVVGDAREVELPKADLYVCGDVLEHMSRDEAVALIEKIKGLTTDLFVSIPIIEYHQGAIEGNPFEVHHYHWGFEEMEETLGDGVATWKGDIIGAYHWTKPAPKKTARKAAPKKAA